MSTIDQLFSYTGYSTTARSTSSAFLGRVAKQDSPYREVLAGDSVSISSQAKALSTLTGLGLSSLLGNLVVSTDEHLDEAGRMMQAKLAEAGLSEVEPFTLAMGDGGEVTVEPPDHPQAEAIEQILEDNPEIANHIRGASQTAVTEKLAEAATKVAQYAAANPAGIDDYYARLMDYAQSLSQYGYSAVYQDGGMSSRFTDTEGKEASLPDFSLVG